ncbi:hypothetical protein [Clostridium pasteurianum]|nr:hypothetical protein [Clostridium pasteurianum]
MSEVSEKLKDCYTDASEESKMKRIYRFFVSTTIKSDYFIIILLMKL